MKGFSIEHVIDSVIKFIKLQETSTVSMDHIANFISTVMDEMKLLNNCSSPGWHEYTKAIHPQLEDLKDPDLSPQDRLTQTRKVLEMFQTLKGNSHCIKG